MISETISGPTVGGGQWQGQGQRVTRARAAVQGCVVELGQGGREAKEGEVVFTERAWAKVRTVVGYASGVGSEVGMMAVTDPQDGLRVTDVRVLKQRSGAATADIDGGALAEHMEEMAMAGVQPWQCMRMWIHSHPWDGKPTPSGTDWETFAKELSDGDWGVMLIVDKNTNAAVAYVRVGRRPGPVVVKEVGVVVEREERTVAVEDAEAWLTEVRGAGVAARSYNIVTQYPGQQGGRWGGETNGWPANRCTECQYHSCNGGEFPCKGCLDTGGRPHYRPKGYEAEFLATRRSVRTEIRDCKECRWKDRMRDGQNPCLMCTAKNDQWTPREKAEVVKVEVVGQDGKTTAAPVLEEKEGNMPCEQCVSWQEPGDSVMCRDCTGENFEPRRDLAGVAAKYVLLSCYDCQSCVYVPRLEKVDDYRCPVCMTAIVEVLDVQDTPQA